MNEILQVMGLIIAIMNLGYLVGLLIQNIFEGKNEKQN